MDTPDQQKPDLTRYVEELRSKEEYPEGDAWISLTDAARITRTSEAMARRWVSSGRIPVKKEAVGINARTRLVRISDVAQIRPIVDPTAAITDEIHKLDLASIPRQQKQIMEDYQRLTAEAAALRGIVEQFATEIRDRLRSELDTLEVRLNSRADRLSSALEQQLAEINGSLTAHLNELAERLTTQDQDQQHRLQEASARLQEESTRLELARQEQQKQIDTLSREKDALLTDTKAIRQEIESEVQARDQLQRDLAALEQRQQAALDERFQEFQQVLEQQFHQFQTQLENLERDQARDVASLTTQFDTITSRLEQMNTAISSVKTTAESNRQSAIAQEKRLDALQQEHEARRVLPQQQQRPRVKGRRADTTNS